MDLRRPRRGPKLYEGKAKILYQTSGGRLIQYFKDDVTAFNNTRRGVIPNKGIINNLISEMVMTSLASIGVPGHLIARVGPREQLIHQVEVIPLEIIVRNRAAGNLCRRLGLEEGEVLPRPLLETCYKSDGLGDPLVSEEHILSFGWASPQEMDDMTAMALRINDFLSGLMRAIQIVLVDFKLEFGRLADEHGESRVILIDEISPDTCRLWDLRSGDRLDKDRFRLDLGDADEAYREVARRFGLLTAEPSVTPVAPQVQECD